MTQKQIFILSFFVLLVLIFLQLVGVFRLFLVPMIWAAILTLVFYPLHRRLLGLSRGRKNVAATLSVSVVVILTLGPLAFFSGTLIKEMLEFYQKMGSWISEKRYEAVWGQVSNSHLRLLWEKLVERTGALNIQIVPVVQRAIQSMTQNLLGEIQNGAKSVVFFILYYFVMVVILFFFFRDGETMGRGLKHLFPMTRENKEMIFERLGMTISAVVRGLVVTGVVQAILAGLAFWGLGVPYPVFLALLIGFLALVPIGGAFLIWLPSSFYLFFTGHWGKAVMLFVWGTLVISTIDNLLRPILIGERTKLPTIFLFLAILGGIVFYGFVGVFLGPIMLALFLTLIEIYRKEYPYNSGGDTALPPNPPSIKPGG